MKSNQPNLKTFDVFIDGASKGNPGPAGIGVIICRGTEVIKNIAAYIGKNTNNAAEYEALIYALEGCLIEKGECLNIKTDSELLFKQINGAYKVKNENIRIYFEKVKRLMAGFQRVTVTHIPRTENKGADKLANIAIKNNFNKFTSQDDCSSLKNERKVRAPEGSVAA